MKVVRVSRRTVSGVVPNEYKCRGERCPVIDTSELNEAIEIARAFVRAGYRFITITSWVRGADGMLRVYRRRQLKWTNHFDQFDKIVRMDLTRSGPF